jgi:hypothetical protein
VTLSRAPVSTKQACASVEDAVVKLTGAAMSERPDLFTVSDASLTLDGTLLHRADRPVAQKDVVTTLTPEGKRLSRAAVSLASASLRLARARMVDARARMALEPVPMTPTGAVFRFKTCPAWHAGAVLQSKDAFKPNIDAILCTMAWPFWSSGMRTSRTMPSPSLMCTSVRSSSRGAS